MFSAACRFGMRVVAEVPFNVFDISLPRYEPQGKDRGRMAASRDAMNAENASALFLNTVEAQKGFFTRKQNKGGDYEQSQYRKHIAGQTQTVL